MKIEKSECKYFDSLVYFIMSFVSVSLTLEVYTGGGSPYRIKDRMVLQAKQLGKKIVVIPHSMLNDLFTKAVWPNEILIEEELCEKPPIDAKLKMGFLETPSIHILTSMFGNYYESNIEYIVSKFGTLKNWPDCWKFGRVIRNACFHDGCIYINDKVTDVKWVDLSYNHKNNGHSIVNTDMWPADFIYLMMEMDEFLK